MRISDGVQTCALPISLLRVVLDDELFLQSDVDLRALGKLVNQDPQTRADNLQPPGNRAIADGLTRNLERKRGERLLLDIDDVVLRDAVARDVDLLVVHEKVTVRDQLTCLTARAREACAVHAVVETRLNDGQ